MACRNVNIPVFYRGIVLHSCFFLYLCLPKEKTVIFRNDENESFIPCHACALLEHERIES